MSTREIHVEIPRSSSTRASRRASHAHLGVKDLPPLPEPDRFTQRTEACRGCTLFFSVSGGLLGLAHVIGAAPFSSADALSFRDIVLFCMYADFLLALTCLLGLLCGDPGTLKRSEESCFPLPQSVVKRIEANRAKSKPSESPLDGLPNINAKSGNYTFCIRCCIWRPMDSNIHHCSVCQRCIRRHDHHCCVFGRCIAGRTMEGSMRWYVGIWLCLGLGFVLFFMALFAAA